MYKNWSESRLKKSAKKKIKKEKKLHRSNTKDLVKVYKKELLYHRVDSKQLEEGHAAKLNKIDELYLAKIKAKFYLEYHHIPIMTISTNLNQLVLYCYFRNVRN